MYSDDSKVEKRLLRKIFPDCFSFQEQIQRTTTSLSVFSNFFLLQMFTKFQEKKKMSASTVSSAADHADLTQGPIPRRLTCLLMLFVFVVLLLPAILFFSIMSMFPFFRSPTSEIDLGSNTVHVDFGVGKLRIRIEQVGDDDAEKFSEEIEYTPVETPVSILDNSETLSWPADSQYQSVLPPSSPFYHPSRTLNSSHFMTFGEYRATFLGRKIRSIFSNLQDNDNHIAKQLGFPSPFCYNPGVYTTSAPIRLNLDEIERLFYQIFFPLTCRNRWNKFLEADRVGAKADISRTVIWVIFYFSIILFTHVFAESFGFPPGFSAHNIRTIEFERFRGTAPFALFYREQYCQPCCCSGFTRTPGSSEDDCCTFTPGSTRRVIYFNFLLNAGLCLGMWIVFGEEVNVGKKLFDEVAFGGSRDGATTTIYMNDFCDAQGRLIRVNENNNTTLSPLVDYMPASFVNSLSPSFNSNTLLPLNQYEFSFTALPSSSSSSSSTSTSSSSSSSSPSIVRPGSANFNKGWCGTSSSPPGLRLRAAVSAAIASIITVWLLLFAYIPLKLAMRTNTALHVNLFSSSITRTSNLFFPCHPSVTMLDLHAPLSTEEALRESSSKRKRTRGDSSSSGRSFISDAGEGEELLLIVGEEHKRRNNNKYANRNNNNNSGRDHSLIVAAAVAGHNKNRRQLLLNDDAIDDDRASEVYLPPDVPFGGDTAGHYHHTRIMIP